MRPIFGGIWPALVTPLDEAGRPSHAALEQLVELFVRQRLDGLYILGSTGQWPLLTPEERRAVADRVVRTAAGRIPVIVHVGAVNTADAVDLARHAARVGTDGVASMAPIYYPAGPDVAFAHYRRIGEATDLPLFIYHLSGVSQLSLEPRAYAERLQGLPHLGGMKITDRDLYPFGLIHSYTGGRIALFSGADEVLCHAALSGAVGAIGSFYNLWGPACQAARRAFVGGAFETGREFMLTFQRVIARVQESGSVWSFLRAALRIKYGIDVGMPRPPLGSQDRAWDDAEVEGMIRQVDECPTIAACPDGGLPEQPAAR
jgi:N-acetylneuraminate lyase